VLNGSPSQLPFTLDDPARLAGLPRTSVKLLDWGGKKAALVTYGQHLGAILVLERQASARDPLSFAAGALQRVQLVGATGSELPTALGTVISFQRGGISYLVAGSVPPVAAETAARGL
jgi:hypothetical protein